MFVLVVGINHASKVTQSVQYCYFGLIILDGLNLCFKELEAKAWSYNNQPYD